MNRLRLLALLTALVALCRPAASQDHGFNGIMAVYPSGGAAGTTVEVDLRPWRRGVIDITVSGKGVTASLLRPKEEPRDYDWQPDRGYPIFQNKCNGCHALPNPVVQRRTREEWASIVELMVKKHGAPIALGEMSEGSLIIQYLGKATQSAAGLRARLTIAPDAEPGLRELRMVGKDWTSQAAVFEVTRDREILELGTNVNLETAQPLPLPSTVSGQLNEARELDYYSVEVKRGRRFIVRCSSWTPNAAYFFPRLRLFDASGRGLLRSEGHDGFDPLLDYTPTADGKIFIGVDDLFSRGGSVMVYRLRISDAPHDATLFPAGLRRGTTIEAELSGENAGCPPVRLDAKESPPGLQRASTPRGSYPYVVGDYPEVVRQAQDQAIRVKFPVSLNGRFLSPGQKDLFLVDVSPEDLGKPYALEIFGGRIGSPVEAKVVLSEGDRIRHDKTPLIHSEGQPIAYSGKFDTNWPAYKLGASLFGRDERFDVTFSHPGTYALEVSEVNGRSGPGFVYRIQAGPAEPDFDVAITPDNPTVRPGSSVYLEIHPLRRHLLDGSIEVRFSELPPGITASRGVIRPDRGRSFIVLTAAADAKPGLVLRTRPVATAMARGRELLRRVRPYEMRDHCYRTLPFDEVAITVSSRPSWSASLEADSPTVKPGQSIKVKVKLDRRGTGDADVPFFIFSDHKDIRISGLPTVAAGANESVVTVSLDARSQARDPIQIVVVNGLNEWIGVTSGAMNRASSVLELNPAP